MKKLYIITLALFAVAFTACDDNDAGSSGLKLTIDAGDLADMTANFTSQPGSRTVPVTTTLSKVNITSSADWCTAELIEDNGMSLRVSVTENKKYISRVADVILYAKGVANVTIPITQSAVDYPYTGGPAATGTNVDTAKEGEAVTITGAGFGIDPRVVKVYFNDAQAEVESVEDGVIEVVMPKVTDDTNSMLINCEVKVVVDGITTTLTTDFAYEKQWYLTTVTGNGTDVFKAGKLSEAQMEIRLIAIGENGDVFGNHRDDSGAASTRQIIRINEAEDVVESIIGPITTWTPNGITYVDGVLYVAADGGNGRTYYTIEKDEEGIWSATQHTVDLGDDEIKTPDKDVYMYKLVYNTQDGHLYGFVGGNSQQSTNGVYGSFITRINPETDKGTLYYHWEKQPYWYAQAFSPDYSKLYTGVGGNGNNEYGFLTNYGLWELSTANLTGAPIRLNSSGATGAANSTTLKDGPLADAGFGQCWAMAWGPDGRLYMSDVTNHIIRAVDLTTNTVETFFGLAGTSGNVDGLKDVGRLNGPRGIVWNAEGTALYVSDFTGARIRKIYME